MTDSDETDIERSFLDLHISLRSRVLLLTTAQAAGIRPAVVFDPLTVLVDFPGGSGVRYEQEVFTFSIDV